jgi:hypothetical protein
VKKFSFVLVLLVLFCGLCQSASLQVTTAPAAASVKHGASIAMTATLKNTLTPIAPVTLAATVDWVDEESLPQTASASSVITVIQPITVSAYRVTIPTRFSFVTGTGTIGGSPGTPTVASGVLTFPLITTLNEGQSLVLGYTIKAP